MFVISSALDQTNTRDPIEKRMADGIKGAGTSITITSMTNGIAFFLGCSSSLTALSSFCFFAGLGVLFLYFTSITIYTAFMVWDLKRQMAQKGDCCGLCGCSEDTIICCRGSCLTQKQRSYPFQGYETDPVPTENMYSNGTQKFLQEKFAKNTISKPGTIIILSAWLLYTIASCVALTKLNIDFKLTFFISEDAFINEYLNRLDKYFKSGEEITFYTDNADIDYSTVEVQ